MKTPWLAVSIGSPAGIGPEVALAAVAPGSTAWRAVLFGDATLLRERAGAVGVAGDRICVVDSVRGAKALDADRIAVIEIGAPLSTEARCAGRPSPEGGAVQLAWIDAACDAVVGGDADAIVTGPASKREIADSGVSEQADRFRGHTEHLGERLGEPDNPCPTTMAFVADALTITLVTTHLSIARVPHALTIDDVVRATLHTCALVDELGVDAALAVAVLALNPHAGEGGLLGDEESRVIAPAIARAQSKTSRRIVGPSPAESAIRQAARSQAYAACVAMYHDQATIPSKLVAFGDAVNVTLGLPIVRTSVDHGTAFDLAGTGKADARGMIAALDLAARLVQSKRG